MKQGKEAILVTGSSGLIGSAVIRHLAPHFQLVGFDLAGDPQPPIEAECICVDVTSEESVQAGLHRLRYAYGDTIASVIHWRHTMTFRPRPALNMKKSPCRARNDYCAVCKRSRLDSLSFPVPCSSMRLASQVNVSMRHGRLNLSGLTRNQN